MSAVEANRLLSSSALMRTSSLTNDVPQNAAVYFVTYLKSFSWFTERDSGSIDMAW